MRPSQQRHQPVDQADPEMTGPNKQQRRREPTDRPVAPRPFEQAGRDHCRDQHDPADIHCQWSHAHDPADAGNQRASHACRRFEFRQSFVDQEEAHVSRAMRDTFENRVLLGELDSHSRHFVFGQRASFGNGFDDVAILVARLEIHAAINGSRIAEQRLFHDAQRFDELLPINRVQLA